MSKKILSRKEPEGIYRRYDKKVIEFHVNVYLGAGRYVGVNLGTLKLINNGRYLQELIRI